MTTRSALLIVLKWTTASAYDMFAHYGRMLKCGTGGAGCLPSDVCLSGPGFKIWNGTDANGSHRYVAANFVAVRLCESTHREKWHLPKTGQPGPIRYGFDDRLCLTVSDFGQRKNEDMPIEIRRVSLEPCSGKPSQDFIMPKAEWGQGCAGAIRWAVDHHYLLAPWEAYAVVRKMMGGHNGKDLEPWPFNRAMWDVQFWEASWILSAREQQMLAHVLVILTLATLFIQALRVLRTICLNSVRFFAASSHVGIRAAAIAVVQHCACWAQQLLQRISGAKDAEVRDQYNAQRIARVQLTIGVMQPLLSLVLIGNICSRPGEMIWNFFTPPESNDPDMLSRAVASTGLLPMVVLYVWATTFSVCPRIMSARALDSSNVLLTAVWAVHVGVVRTKARQSGYNDTVAWERLVQVFTSTLLGNAGLATVLQSMLTAVLVFGHVRSNLSGGTYASSHEPRHELIMMLMFLAFIWLIDLQTWREATATMNAKQADNGRVLVSRVLESMCDAVVLVDESFCIGKEGSPQLAALLMHQGFSAVSPLKGVSLKELVINEDRERFQAFMMRELSAAKAGFGVRAPIASSLHIHFRDAFDIPVSMELFCSCALGVEGGGSGPRQYLLGVREQEVTHRMPATPQGQPLQQDGNHHNEAPSERASVCSSNQNSRANSLPLGPISEMDQSDSDDSGSSSSSVMHSHVSVWIDLESEDLTCLHWTPSFASLFPSICQGVGFLQCAPQHRSGDVLAWLRSQAATRSRPSRVMTLVAPRHGNDRKEERAKKGSFFCTVVEDAEYPIPNLSSPGVRVVRLDIEKATRRPRQRMRQRSVDDNARIRNQASHKAIVLWVGAKTRKILKSKQAPSRLFRAGSRLVVFDAARQEAAADHDLFFHIDMSIYASEMAEDEEHSAIEFGTHTFVTCGYLLRAEISLTDWGGAWNGTQEHWWRLTLCNACLLGKAEQQSALEGTHDQDKVAM